MSEVRNLATGHTLELHDDLRQCCYESAIKIMQRCAIDYSAVSKSPLFSRQEEGEEVFLPTIGALVESLEGLRWGSVPECLPLVIEAFFVLAKHEGRVLAGLEELERAKGANRAHAEACRFVPIVALARLEHFCSEVGPASMFERAAEGLYALGLDLPMFERCTSKARLEEYCARYGSPESPDDLRSHLLVWKPAFVRLERPVVAARSSTSITTRTRAAKQL